MLSFAQNCQIQPHSDNENHTLAISGVTAIPTEFGQSGSSVITVDAEDEDGNDLTYSYSGPIKTLQSVSCSYEIAVVKSRKNRKRRLLFVFHFISIPAIHNKNQIIRSSPA